MTSEQWAVLEGGQQGKWILFPCILSILSDQIYQILNKYDLVNVIPRSGGVSGLAYKGVGLAYKEVGHLQYKEAGHLHNMKKEVMA